MTMRVKERGAKRVALVAPSKARGRSAAAAVRARLSGQRGEPVSLSDLFVRGPAFDGIVLCPGGADVERDLGFLQRARDRVLWPAPDPDLHGAIAGLLGHGHDLPDSSAPVARGRAHRKIAFLFEGLVTPARVRAALRSDARHWIVESALRVRLSERQLTRLRGEGVRWSALKPVRLIALVASPELAQARRRWQRLLPAGTPVWLWDR
jgi:hypothetical protein